jgi:chromosome transmission fidelity protein 18
MTGFSSPQYPSSFDPAIDLHSEHDASNTATFSDDLQQLQTHVEQVTARKNKEGIVIQHRAWKTPDVFRSDEDYSIGTYACIISIP